MNWEYQSERARADAAGTGQPKPLDWEWPGDIETLSIGITHKILYVEVCKNVLK